MEFVFWDKKIEFEVSPNPGLNLPTFKQPGPGHLLSTFPPVAEYELRC